MRCKPGTLLAFLVCVRLSRCRGIRRDIISGDWTDHDPISNPKYLNLAVFAVANRRQGKYYDAVLLLHDVRSKISHGVLYNITYSTAPTNCPVNQPYWKEHCAPVTRWPTKRCVAIIHEQEWDEELQVEENRCWKLEAK